MSEHWAAYYHLVGRNLSIMQKIHEEIVKKKCNKQWAKLTLSKMISSYLYIPSLPFTCQEKKYNS